MTIIAFFIIIIIVFNLCFCCLFVVLICFVDCIGEKQCWLMFANVWNQRHFKMTAKCQILKTIPLIKSMAFIKIYFKLSFIEIFSLLLLLNKLYTVLFNLKLNTILFKTNSNKATPPFCLLELIICVSKFNYFVCNKCLHYVHEIKNTIYSLFFNFLILF